MNIRTFFGLGLIVIGLFMVPRAWGYSQVMTAAAFICLIVGGLLFYTEHRQKREERMARKISAQPYDGRSSTRAAAHSQREKRSADRRRDSGEGGSKDDAADGADGDGGD